MKFAGGVLMSLGLDTLSDDQLLNLWRELYSEMGCRLYGTTEMAYQIVLEEKEKAKARLAALQEAVEKCRVEYDVQLRKEVLEDVRAGVRDGSIKLVDAKMEGDMVARAALEAKITLIGDVIEKVMAGR